MGNLPGEGGAVKHPSVPIPSSNPLLEQQIGERYVSGEWIRPRTGQFLDAHLLGCVRQARYYDVDICGPEGLSLFLLFHLV